MTKKKGQSPSIPEDGVILCSRCGKMVDLNEPGAEAFQCEKDSDKFFCSNNCLREYVLEADDLSD